MRWWHWPMLVVAFLLVPPALLLGAFKLWGKRCPCCDGRIAFRGALVAVQYSARCDFLDSHAQHVMRDPVDTLPRDAALRIADFLFGPELYP